MAPASHPTVLATLRELDRPVWLLLVGMLINRLGSYLQIYLVLYLTHRGYSAAAAGVALGAYGAGSVVGVAGGGSLADRFGHRRTVAVPMAAGGVLTLGIVYLDHLPLLVLVSALIGAAAQMYRPASSALLIELTPRSQHVMVFAIFRLAFNLGTTGGPLVGAVLIVFSYELIFFVDAATSVLFGIMALSLPSLRAGQARGAGGAEATRASYRALLADRRFLVFMLALFLHAVVYIQHIAVLPVQITEVGHSTTVYASLLTLNAAVVIALELYVTRYVQRMPAKLAVALGIGLVGVGMNLYVAGPALGLLVAATLVWTVGEIIGAPMATAYPGWVAPPRMRSRYMAAGAVPQQIGYAVGPPLGLATWAVWPAGVWWACGVITVAAVLATLFGMVDTRAQEAAEDGDAGPREEPEPAPAPQGA